MAKQTVEEKQGFRVDKLLVKGGSSASCMACGWEGKASSLKEVGGCALTAGEEVPAGRCPQCGGLVAPKTTSSLVEAIAVMAQLVEYDELLRKGKPVDADGYGRTLKEAKRLAKVNRVRGAQAKVEGAG